MLRFALPLLLSFIVAACSETPEANQANGIVVTGQSAAATARPAPREVVGQAFVSAVLGHFDFAQASAKLASDRAGLPSVQTYAQKLTADIEAARQALAPIASADGLTLTATAGPTDQSDLAILSSSRGQPIAKAFAEQQMETLTLLVGTMRAYKNGGDNESLRGWAEAYQGRINDRLLDVQTLNAEVETALLPPDQR